MKALITTLRVSKESVFPFPGGGGGFCANHVFQARIQQPLACAALYDDLGPTDYYKRLQGLFRWAFLWVGEDNLVHEYDEEGDGWVLGTTDDLANVARKAATAIVA
jgi:hypothetical protein